MLIINSPSTDPYFNLAAEEHLLKNFNDDIFMLYRNEPSVVVGKHQNTMEEVNIEFVTRNNVKVVRRLSGGGTVYHDLGNLNFTFILNGIDKRLIDFKRYTQPIVDALISIGVKAKFEGRNDIRVDGKKISGNAEHIYRKRVLHHGTLLFDSDLYRLNQAIKVKPGSYQSNSVKSVRSTVTNIKEHLPKDISLKDFSGILQVFVKKTYPNIVSYLFNDGDLQTIQNLIETKYSRWEWNYGYSPTYSVTNSISVSGSTYEFLLQVENGLIKTLSISNNLVELGDLSDVEKKLIGIPHNPEIVYEKLQQADIKNSLPGLTLEKLISVLF